MGIAKLKSLNLPSDTSVMLTLEEGTDVFVHNETEVETALSETDVVQNFAELITTTGFQGTSAYGGENLLDTLRDEGLLDDYDRGSLCFAEYVAEQIHENFYDVDLIDYTTEKYDHKRGFCTLSATVKTTVGNLIEAAPYLGSWNISVKTGDGTLRLD